MNANVVDDSLDDLLIVVDERDRQTGTATKLGAHVEGLLHRAFSVLLWREGPAGVELLIQRRALTKYHSGGLYANSCCSHPRNGETLAQAVPRRLAQELGVHVEEVAGLQEVGSFVYLHQFEKNLFEHEFDHVFVGSYDGPLDPDPTEVMELAWVSLAEVERDLAARPERYAVWFAQVLELSKPHLRA